MGFGDKKKQTEIRKLSECKIKEGIAFCPKCEEFFIDDLKLAGSTPCPNSCESILHRGFTIKDRTIFHPNGRKFRTL